MPRSGTTSLSTWLDGHPDVVLSRPKEPGFFAQDLPMSTVEQSASAYSRSFAHAGDEAYRLDATPWYLYSKTAAERIVEAVPDAKFIVLFRNPVDQIVSEHRHHIKVGFETEWDLMRATSSPRSHRADDFRYDLDYVDAAKIGAHLERLFSVADRDRVHLIEFQDLESDPRAVYRELLGWLSLEVVEPPHYDAMNLGMRVRSRPLHRLLLRGRRKSMPRIVRAASIRLNNLNLRPAADTGPPQHVRSWLLSQLEPDIELLERLLDRSFDHWRAAITADAVEAPG